MPDVVQCLVWAALLPSTLLHPWPGISQRLKDWNASLHGARHSSATSGTDESKVLVVNEIDLSIAGSLSTEALEDLRTTLCNLPGLMLVLYPEMIGSKKALAHAAALAGVRTGSLPTDGDAVPTSVVETTPGDSLTELWVERQRIDSYLSSTEVLKSAGGRWPLPINLNCEDEKTWWWCTGCVFYRAKHGLHSRHAAGPAQIRINHVRLLVSLIATVLRLAYLKLDFQRHVLFVAVRVDS